MSGLEGMIGFNCDLCKMAGLLVSSAGLIYCPNCGVSYGDQIIKPE